MAAELPQEVANVVAYGCLGEAEPDGDLTGRDPCREQLEHLALAPAQAACGRRCAPAPRVVAASGLRLSL